MKLHRQLVLLLIAALLPLVALSVVLAAGSLAQQQQAMKQEALNRVSVLSTGIDRELAAQAEVLQALAQLPALDGPFDRARFGKLAPAPAGPPAAVAGPDGARSPGRADHGHAAGAPVAPADSPRPASFDQAVRTGRPVVGRINRSPQIRPAFAIFAPVVRGGQVVYVLSAVLEPGAIERLLRSDDLPNGWRAGVLDGAGRLVARTERLPDLIARTASPSARAAMARADTGVFRVTTSDGVAMITAFRVLPGSRWAVYVALPSRLYAAPFTRALWILGAGLLGSMLLAGVFLTLLWRELKLRERESEIAEREPPAGGAGPDDRRRRPRLQQPPDDHAGQRRDAEAASGGPGPGGDPGRRHPHRRPARPNPDAPAPRLRPPQRAPAGELPPAGPHRGAAQPLAALHLRGDQADPGHPGRDLAAARRPERARGGPDQPRRERPRRHARGRPADHHRPQRRPAEGAR
ncbi:MAG: hypothetical protein WDM92_09775 [Caulobacteraceae bacterium]